MIDTYFRTKRVHDSVLFVMIYILNLIIRLPIFSTIRMFITRNDTIELHTTWCFGKFCNAQNGFTMCPPYETLWCVILLMETYHPHVHRRGAPWNLRGKHVTWMKMFLMRENSLQWAFIATKTIGRHLRDISISLCFLKSVWALVAEGVEGQEEENIRCSQSMDRKNERPCKSQNPWVIEWFCRFATMKFVAYFGIRGVPSDFTGCPKANTEEKLTYSVQN